jgi:hypothetical protein
MISNIEPIAREITRSICRDNEMPGAQIEQWVNLHWQCAAAMLEAGVMDEKGEWIEGKDLRRGLEAYLLKGPEAEDHTLYASHTVWENRAVFEAWTKSEAFRAAHSRAGDNKPLYLDHPQFEGFEVRQTVGRGKAEVA